MTYQRTTSGIYAIVNRANGHFYLGSSIRVGMRLRQHRRSLISGKHCNAYLQRAWNLYGPDAFDFRLMMTCPVDELRRLEALAIEAMKPQYNLTYCVDGEMVRSERCRQAIRAALIGHPVSAETRAKMSASQKGKPGHPVSSETRAKLSASKMGCAPTRTGPLSAETKAKMSVAQMGNKKCLGHTLSDEHKAKIGASQKLRHAKRRTT